MSSFSETSDAEVTTSVTHFGLCAVKKSARYRAQTAPYAFESLTRMSNADQSTPHCFSQKHLALQAYCSTDVDDINPLGIEIWYQTTILFSILDGIEAIRSVPKKYRTRYPALAVFLHQFHKHLNMNVNMECLSLTCGFLSFY